MMRFLVSGGFALVTFFVVLCTWVIKRELMKIFYAITRLDGDVDDYGREIYNHLVMKDEITKQ